MQAAPATSVGSSGHHSGLSFDCVQDAAVLARMAEEWDEVLAEMPRPSPFLNSIWIGTWWQHFGAGRRLWVITARDRGGRLQGVAPLYLARRRRAGPGVRALQLLGYRGSAVCTDHLDFLSRQEGRAEIIAALVGEIGRRRREWDVAELADLAGDSAVPEAFAEAGGFRSAVTPGEICYYIRLPGDVASLWAQLKKAHPQLVSNVKRYRKRLETDLRARFVAEAVPEEREAVMAALARLHGVARARKGEAGNFGRDEYRAFHHDAAERMAASGRLYLARLEVGGEIVAVLYGFVEGGVLYFYQSGFDTRWEKYGIGKLLMASVLEDAVERLRASEFDYLRGDEEYKKRWCSDLRRTQHLGLWGDSVAAGWDRASWQVHRGLQRGRAWAKRLSGGGRA